MALKKEREFDKTHLSIDQAETRGFIHRDYIAHCLRWSHIAKAALLSEGGKYSEKRYLDIGCGKDQPLARMLYSNKAAPKDGYYIGLELNKMTVNEVFKNSSWKPTIIGEIDATTGVDVDSANKQITIKGEVYKSPTTVVCLEVLEHMAPRHCLNMVLKFAELAEAGATIYASTPCYDEAVGAAGNHINELTHDALGALFEDNGLAIENVFGTFASERDYVPALSEAELEVFNKLKAYHCTNVLSNVFAPLHPRNARNCIWVLKYQPADYVRKYLPLAEVAEPWTSSPDYKDLAG